MAFLDCVDCYNRMVFALRCALNVSKEFYCRMSKYLKPRAVATCPNISHVFVMFICLLFHIAGDRHCARIQALIGKLK